MNQITLQESGTLRLTRSHTYDNLNRPSGVVSTPASGPVVSDNYQYNLLNERTSATLADGSHWDYQYDAKGEVTSGRKVWSDGTPVAGEQHGELYTHDLDGHLLQDGRWQYTWDGANRRLPLRFPGNRANHNL